MYRIQTSKVKRYVPGQYFLKHVDFQHNRVYSLNNRIATVIAILREPDVGGDLIFPYARRTNWIPKRIVGGTNIGPNQNQTEATNNPPRNTTRYATHMMMKRLDEKHVNPEALKELHTNFDICRLSQMRVNPKKGDL